MPIKKAAFKHLRQTKQRTARNRRDERTIRTALKKTLRALEQGASLDTIQSLTLAAVKTIDKAVQHGVLKANTGARKKSRLLKRLRAAKTTKGA